MIDATDFVRGASFAFLLSVFGWAVFGGAAYALIGG